MDYDTYSANDAIGKVYIDLNPLLWPSTPTPVKKDSTDGSSSKEDNNKHPGNGSLQYFPTKYWQSGVPTRDSLSRRILNVRDLS